MKPNGKKEKEVAGLRKPLGELCVESGLISRVQLDQALIKQKTAGGRLGRLLVSRRMISERDLAGRLSAQTGWPFVDVCPLSLEQETVSKIPEGLARKHRALAVSHDTRTLTVVMADPLDFEAVRDIGFSCGMEVSTAIGVPADILEAIDRSYRTTIDIREIFHHGNSNGNKCLPEVLQDVLSVKAGAGGPENGAVSPIIRLTGILISEAIKQRVSDIHIEPGARELLIRFRMDGLLREYSRMPMGIHGYLVSRFKILGKLDIAERRLPQDGAVRVKSDDRDIDLRISTLPTVFGEKLVMRVLDREQLQIPLKSLGFGPAHLQTIRSLTSMSKGIILV
ncbi:MAG TPA: ATPase, T2SS/T4P/T4SS family, partial [Nitrospiria bacterium]